MCLSPRLMAVPVRRRKGRCSTVPSRAPEVAVLKGGFIKTLYMDLNLLQVALAGGSRGSSNEWEN